MTKDNIEMEQLSVSPYIIIVNDISSFDDVGADVDISPAYYDCILRISPYVILKLLQWLMKNQYIKLSGKLTLSIRGRKFTYVK